MDAGTALLMVTLFAPPIVVFVFRRTCLWWVAGTALVAVGVYLLANLRPVGGHDGEIESWDSVGNTFQAGYGVCMLLYGAFLLVTARLARRAALELRPEPPLPIARMI